MMLGIRGRSCHHLRHADPAVLLLLSLTRAVTGARGPARFRGPPADTSTHRIFRT
jgi:hypothetical protein